jgi:4-alpha-glucanotransferase
MVEDGLLPRQSLPAPPPGAARRADHAAAARLKTAALRASWEHVRRGGPEEAWRDFQDFAGSPEQSPWLEDWSLFAALKAAHGGRPWLEWDAELARREPAALRDARARLDDACAFHRYVQFLFFRQWGALRRKANDLGVRILGDVPIYPALDSADVWAHRELFHLDGDGRPTVVAGVPPDYFSETGQLWGNPLYRWDRMEAGGFAWWIRRLEANARLVDLVRLDHFRGFSAYWEVPVGEVTAVRGRWVEAPGERLFEAVRSVLAGLPIIAEDLGLITPDVHRLRQRFGFPGMRVLQFAFGGDDNEHLPHRLDRHGVVYTGTHDNDTTAGWFLRLAPDEARRVLVYTGAGRRDVAWGLIRVAYASVAALAVAPAQDHLGLGSAARMNTPGIAAGNWAWRAEPGAFDDALAERTAALARATGRR